MRLTPKLVLAALVVCAVLIAVFAVYLPWRDGQQPVSDSEMLEIDRQMTDTALELQSMLSERLSVKQLAAEQERQDSEIGQALALRCAQWTEVNDARPTEESEAFQEWACKRYNQYVTRGELLPDEPPTLP
jgi:hypothetical protein